MTPAHQRQIADTNPVRVTTLTWPFRESAATRVLDQYPLLVRHRPDGPRANLALVSPSLVRREDVVLRLDDRMARKPARGAFPLGGEFVGRGVIVEDAPSPSATLRESLAVLHHECDIPQPVRDRDVGR